MLLVLCKAQAGCQFRSVGENVYIYVDTLKHTVTYLINSSYVAVFMLISTVDFDVKLLSTIVQVTFQNRLAGAYLCLLCGCH